LFTAGRQMKLYVFAQPLFASLIEHAPDVLRGSSSRLAPRLVEADSVLHTTSTCGSGVS
jgi:hypothetical protein